MNSDSSSPARTGRAPTRVRSTPIPGRPFPDTGMDYRHGYRFGMPFFIPVEYYDTRVQLLNNISLARGGHLYKAGVEWNRVESVQTFIGFANGRYIFDSVDGFLNFVEKGNRYVECSDGSFSTEGCMRRGRANHRTGPVLPGTGRRGRADRGGSGHPANSAARIGTVRAGQLAGFQQVDDQLRLALGGADSARPDHRSYRRLLRRFHRKNRDQRRGRPQVPIQWKNPSRPGYAAAADRPGL